MVRRVQEDGTCWFSGTTWHGIGAMRISVSNWRTTAEDVERSADRDPPLRPGRCLRLETPS